MIMRLKRIKYCCGVTAILLILSLLIIFGNSNDKFDREFIARDDEITKKRVLQLLEEQNIPHKVDKNGYILFRKVDENRVMDIILEVKRAFTPENEVFDNKAGISFALEEHEKLFLSLLEEENIPYELQERLDGRGLHQIVWDKQYNDKVKKIKLKVYRKIGIPVNAEE